MDPAARLTRAWQRLAPLPGGRRLFALLLRIAVPYSGTVRPRVLRLEPGRATLEIRDRRGLRNHLRSVHAIALANAAELVSGMAMVAALPPGARGIPIRLEIDYLRKARGRIRAEGAATAPPHPMADVEAEARAELFDAAGETVARARVTWRIGPAPAPPAGAAPPHAPGREAAHP